MEPIFRLALRLMARFTSAYSSLVIRLEEVNNLLDIAIALERQNPVKNADKINALSRGAVVLLSSHIEGYIKEVGELTLTRIFDNSVCRSQIPDMVSYFASRDLIFEIKDTADSTKLAKKISELFSRDRSLWEQLGPHPTPISEERFNKSFSSPSIKKIYGYYRRFGYQLWKKDLARALAAEYNMTVNLIDNIVNERNKIAHGHFATTTTPADIRKWVPIVKKFCRISDQLFGDWCRKEVCSIR